MRKWIVGHFRGSFLRVAVDSRVAALREGQGRGSGV